MWKAVLDARLVLQKGLCRRIGNGVSTSIWFDPWVPSSNRTPIPLKDVSYGVAWANQFLLPDKRWNVSMEPHETSLHLFWNCAFAKAIWFTVGWGIRTDLVQVTNWQLWTEWFLPDCNRPPNVTFYKFMTTTLCIVEEIWKERNKRVHGEIESDIIKVITLIRHKNEDHMLVSTKNLTDVLTWSPPPASWLCCNSNVAISSTGCMLAAVFRDEFSNIVSITTSRALFTEPLLAEAHAVCLVAEYAANMGLNRVLFQSDNLGVVKEFRNSESPIADFRLQVAKSRFQKSCTNLLEWDINHISRKCNFLVHNIAKWAVFKNVEGSLKPSELDGSVMDDLVEWDPGSRSNGSGAMV
uniref:RNase H type-1 domain-containing protein n=1 Tax=Cannabis sativa TaxID=3483 RepID=A0A803QC20_CANSA